MLKLLQHKITEILTLNLDPRWGQVPIYFLLSLNWITFWGAGQNFAPTLIASDVMLKSMYVL
jgi:hypothetical protein